MTEPTTLAVGRPHPGIVTVGLDRAVTRNALDAATVERFQDVLSEVRAEPCVLVVHSRVDGVFASGVDLRELLTRDADAALQRINVDLFERLARHRWPTIAAIDGYALGGGCELALACDLRVASALARLGQPETGLGVLAGAGGNWRLPRLVGVGQARRLLFTGEVVDGERALALGLVEYLDDHPYDAAVALATKIAERSWRALELTKLALAAGESPTTGLDVVAQAYLFDGTEKSERISNFLASRHGASSTRQE